MLDFFTLLGGGAGVSKPIKSSPETVDFVGVPMATGENGPRLKYQKNSGQITSHF